MYANDPERLRWRPAPGQGGQLQPPRGCLPTFATLRVHRPVPRVINAAAEGSHAASTDPSLGGPTSIASRNDGTGFAWLTDFSSGAPPLGWHDTIAYLVLPVLLVIRRARARRSTPETQSTDRASSRPRPSPSLPLMIGFFSLNVPAGLTLYWFANNILSTAQTVYLRKTTKAEPLPAGAGAGGMPMPGTPGARAPAQPVRVEYVPKSQRRRSRARRPRPNPRRRGWSPCRTRSRASSPISTTGRPR